MAVGVSHGAQVYQHEHTHVTQYLRHGQQWEHRTPATTTSNQPSRRP